MGENISTGPNVQAVLKVFSQVQAWALWGLLGLVIIPSHALAQPCVSQAKRDSMEQYITRRIESEQDLAEGWRRELESAQRDFQALMRRNSNDILIRSAISSTQSRIGNCQQSISRCERTISEFRAQLQNLPPVCPDQAETERLEQVRESYRQQQAQQQQQAARNEQARREMQDFLDARNRQAQEKWQRQSDMLNTLSRGFQDLANSWARSRQQDDQDTDLSLDSDPRLPDASLPRQYPLPALLEPQPKTQIVGRLVEPVEPTRPEPAKPLFDSPMVDFLVDVSKETAGTITGALVQSLADPTSTEDPLQLALDNKFAEPKEVLQEWAISLLPPDKQLEIYASKLPLWHTSRSHETIWDKFVESGSNQILDFTPGSESGFPGSRLTVEQLSNYAADLLVKKHQEAREANLGIVESGLTTKPDPNSVTMPRVRGSTPEQGWRDYHLERSTWELNKGQTWRQRVPYANSLEEADHYMRRGFDYWRSQLELKDCLMKEQTTP